MMAKINKIFNAVLTVIIVICFIIIITASISLKNGKVPSVFGYSFSVVQTPSMEPTIMTGDFIITKKQDEYCLNDVISFYSKEQNKVISKTHRIIDIYEEDGITYYKTKGDANSLADSDKTTFDDIIGEVTYQNSFLGSVFTFTFLKNPKNVLLLIIIILILFIISQLSNIIKIVREGKKHGDV